MCDLRLASEPDVTGLGSSWAKRLRIPKNRPAWLLVAERAQDLLHLPEREYQKEQHQREPARDHDP